MPASSGRKTAELMEQTTYIVTRRCSTGVNEYRYFRSIHAIGTGAALVLPRFPVVIASAELSLRYENDLDMTLVPGISRPILREDTGKAYARVFWDGSGKHRLHTPFGWFRIACREDICVIFRENIPIAALGRIQRGSEFDFSWRKTRDADWEPHLTMMTTEDLPDELALLMLSFPLFRLAP